VAHIATDLEKCTGCLMCALACPYEQQKGFNPRYAKIQVKKAISGVPEEIVLAPDCQTCVNRRCVEFCMFEALTAHD